MLQIPLAKAMTPKARVIPITLPPTTTAAATTTTSTSPIIHLHSATSA